MLVQYLTIYLSSMFLLIIFSSPYLNSCVMLYIVCDKNTTIFIYPKCLNLFSTSQEDQISFMDIRPVLSYRDMNSEGPQTLAWCSVAQETMQHAHKQRRYVQHLYSLSLASPFVYSIWAAPWAQNSRWPTIHGIQQDSKQMKVSSLPIQWNKRGAANLRGHLSVQTRT